MIPFSVNGKMCLSFHRKVTTPVSPIQHTFNKYKRKLHKEHHNKILMIIIRTILFRINIWVVTSIDQSFGWLRTFSFPQSNSFHSSLKCVLSLLYYYHEFMIQFFLLDRFPCQIMDNDNWYVSFNFSVCYVTYVHFEAHSLRSFVLSLCLFLNKIIMLRGMFFVCASLNDIMRHGSLIHIVCERENDKYSAQHNARRIFHHTN